MSAVLYFLPLLIQICSGALLPVTKCKISDTQCLKSSAQMAVPLLAPGIPEIGAKPLDLLHVDVIKVNLAGLNLNINNADLKGLKNTKIYKMSVDMANKKINYVYSADLTLKGKYKASGQLLILPISGDGDITMIMKNVEHDINYSFDVVKNADGKDVIKLKSFNFKFSVKDGIHFDVTGLFNGNKELSNAMLKFMNENWKVLSDEFGDPILRTCHKEVFSTIKKYLYAHPIEELADL